MIAIAVIEVIQIRKEPGPEILAMLSGSLSGSGFNTNASKTVNNAVLTPMPSASVSTAINVKLGFFRSIRAP